MPTVLIIGAPNSGKNTLAHVLTQHIQNCRFLVLYVNTKEHLSSREIVCCIVVFSVLQASKHQTTHMERFFKTIEQPIIFAVTCTDVPILSRVSHISTYRDYVKWHHRNCKLFVTSAYNSNTHIERISAHISLCLDLYLRDVTEMEDMLLGNALITLVNELDPQAKSKCYF